jgi:hypothetical protein
MKEFRKRVHCYEVGTNGITQQVVRVADKVVRVEQAPNIPLKRDGWSLKYDCPMQKKTDSISLKPSQADIRRAKRNR